MNNSKDDKDCDKGNEDLYKEVIEKISKLHDREITLLQSDHEEFMSYLNKTGKGRKLKFPVKDPPLIRRSLSSKVSNEWIFVTPIKLEENAINIELDIVN